MLLLERACKAADGVSGHLVIEISTHRGASRTGVDMQLQGMVARAVLFGDFDDSQRAQNEPALQQTAQARLAVCWRGHLSTTARFLSILRHLRGRGRRSR